MSRTIEVVAGWGKSQRASKLLQTECGLRHNMKSLEAGPSELYHVLLSDARRHMNLRKSITRAQEGENMITVTTLALLIYLFGGYIDPEKRQNNECTKSQAK